MDRIASDDPSIESVRGRISRHGGGGRRLEVPGDVLTAEKTIRVIVEETVYFGAVTPRTSSDVDWLTGVFESPRLAKDPVAERDILRGWLEEVGRGIGESIVVDIIAPGYAIGLRAPGERAVYPNVTPPKSSLDAIARSLDAER